MLIATGDRLAPTYPDDKTVISKAPPASEIQRPSAVSPQSIGASLVGKRLEHYDLVEFVGGGGMGAVFRAIDTRLGRTVAVKVLSRDATDDETIRRFQNEAQSAARLDHPNIARVYYVGEDHGWNFIVFEFIEGVNLRDTVDRNGPLPLADALYFTLKVAEALEHSSARDVVHRDIKPSNVLVTADASVKLVDMGLARLHQVDSSSDDLTASGVTLGTFDYISPEQAQDPRLADIRSDIYSLGCTLYFMLTGRPPFPDGTALQKLIRHSREEPDDVRLLRPDLPPRVSALLARMLAKKPAQRQQSAQELVADIAALADQLGLGSAVHRGKVVVASAQREQPWWSRGLQVAVGTAMLLVAILALDAWLPQSAGDGQAAMRPKLPPVAVQPEAENPAIADGSPLRNQPLVVGPPPDRQFASGGGGTNTEGSRPPSVAPAADAAIASAASTPAGIKAAAGSDAEITGLTATDIGGALGPPELAAEIRVDAADAQAVSLGPPPVAPPAAAARIKRLVVDRELPQSAPADTEYLTSLAAACRRAAELSLSEIELAWSGPLVESPLEITHPRLTLRAASGYRPMIVFRPQVAENESRRQMIRVSSGPSSRLTILGVDLRLELPPESAYGWSLLSLRPGQTLEIADCILTVQDGDGTRPPAHQQVAMILVQPRMMAETMAMEPVAGMAAGTTVSIDRSIARGAATFLSLAEDSTLSLRWTQGLLVTPKRLLETTGSATSPKSLDRINLTLESVTAACASGLFQMQRRSGAGFQFGLDVAASHCILVTDPQAPLYEFIGVSEVTQSDFHCDGLLNRYSHPDVAFLRYGLSERPDQVTTIDLKNRQYWSAESQPRPIDQWRTPPSFNRPAHEQTKEDFLIRPEVIIDAGFDPAALPSIQQLAPSSPRPSSPAAVGPPPDSLNSRIGEGAALLPQ
ncbi:MAG: serine/threonine protein kinase [Planctomycetaceae bacterium]|nr:serine/threonine protein kinase [Planctomycetaceae bacterium]